MKIMVELSNSKGRDVILGNAKSIVKSGNNGQNYYISEDASEEERRKRNDLYKYAKYMEYNGHKVEIIGEDILVDGYRKKFIQLNDMPIGDRMMDSCTVFRHGTVAFQSAQSPLSNLFPCKLKIDGRTYSSVEQAYKHAKCLHHNLFQQARDVMQSNNPYWIMNHCKNMKENQLWYEKKTGVMERLIRLKEDQVPIFRDTLRQTINHKLVENSWSPFWGSACNFLEPCVWDGTFRGQNQFKALLERIRDGT